MISISSTTLPKILTLQKSPIAFPLLDLKILLKPSSDLLPPHIINIIVNITIIIVSILLLSSLFFLGTYKDFDFSKYL